MRVFAQTAFFALATALAAALAGTVTAASGCSGRFGNVGHRDSGSGSTDGAADGSAAPDGGDDAGPSDGTAGDDGAVPDDGTVQPDGGQQNDSAVCVPDCNGVPCGGDDGCGTPCSGGHRDANGAVSDCRVPGDCGCGVEPNDNMLCTGSGMCRIHCSCDCLPPQERLAADVAGLDYGGACTLVFQQSNDPSVWDYTNNVPLCPVDHDPQGAARCTECPPCHRDHPPACSWDDWCTCRDPRWIDGYRTECCAAGPQYCF